MGAARVLYEIPSSTHPPNVRSLFCGNDWRQREQRPGYFWCVTAYAVRPRFASNSLTIDERAQFEYTTRPHSANVNFVADTRLAEVVWNYYGNYFGWLRRVAKEGYGESPNGLAKSKPQRGLWRCFRTVEERNMPPRLERALYLVAALLVRVVWRACISARSGGAALGLLMVQMCLVENPNHPLYRLPAACVTVGMLDLLDEVLLLEGS
jgi:hypothetical protein